MFDLCKVKKTSFFLTRFYDDAKVYEWHVYFVEISTDLFPANLKIIT
jgi:hypothetical protein